METTGYTATTKVWINGQPLIDLNNGLSNTASNTGMWNVTTTTFQLYGPK
jgi:hypothetical protein